MRIKVIQAVGAGWSDKHQRIKQAEPNKGAGWKKSQK